MTTEHEHQHSNHKTHHSGSSHDNQHRKPVKWSNIAWKIMVLLGVVSISIVVLVMWTLEYIPLNQPEPNENVPNASAPEKPNIADLTQEAAQ
ncbi:MAG: hypothetical protein ACRC2T_20715 [Thermoguttaceae bacterium]